MKTIELPHDPALDLEGLRSRLARQLQGRYEVSTRARRQTRRQLAFHGPQRVVVVQRGAYRGAFCLLEQKPGTTCVKLWWDVPSDRFFNVFLYVPFLAPLLIVVTPVMWLLSGPVVRDVRSCLAGPERAEEKPAPAPPPLPDEAGEKAEARYTIGCDRGCDVVLADDSVSRRHAELIVTADRLVLQDLGSTNGTSVVDRDGPRRVQRGLVQRSDVLRFGDLEMPVEDLLEAVRFKHPTFRWPR